VSKSSIFLQELHYITASDDNWNCIYVGAKTRLYLILACILNYYEVSVRVFIPGRKDVMLQRVSKAVAPRLGGIELQRTANTSLMGDRVQRREASEGRT
jgi:hypothetical protein